jgi:hypothetical protein
MALIAGFTGTQKGMTSKQAATLKMLLMSEDVNVFHHGDCIGADAAADTIAHEIGARVRIHPPLKSDKRAKCEGAEIYYPAKDYIERNHDIVDMANILFATPAEPKEKMRSGTWATIRYATKKKIKTIVILPDGEVIKYN